MTDNIIGKKATMNWARSAPGTIIGYEKHNKHAVLLAWKKGETPVQGAWAIPVGLNSRLDQTYKNYAKYSYGYWVNISDLEIVEAQADNNSNNGCSNASVAMSIDLSDWRQWTHKVPGECACGIPKSRCDYHR